MAGRSLDNDLIMPHSKGLVAFACCPFDCFPINNFDSAPLYRITPNAWSLEAHESHHAGLGFISANSWDINGAASAGLNTFWIQRSTAEVPEELGFHAIVKAITDLAPLLRG